jgi:hypothetical protein
MNNVSVDYYKANANTSEAYICIVKQRNYMLNLLTPPLFELQKTDTMHIHTAATSMRNLRCTT